MFWVFGLGFVVAAIKLTGGVKPILNVANVVRICGLAFRVVALFVLPALINTSSTLNPTP